jgi:hypothetical protein
MTQTTSEPGSLPLFNHTARKDWGVGVLVREDGGKRAYLFEDGEERTMANGFHQLMRRVEDPSADQRAFYERQRGLIAAREKANSSSTRSDGPTFIDQVEKFHKIYSAGLVDPKWILNVRGEGAETRAPRHREALIREAQEQLSVTALDALLKAQSFAQVWELVVTVLSHTDLVPAAQLKKPKGVNNNERYRGLAQAVRELLHGSAAYETRFDAYLSALTVVLGEPPRWELATALSAAFHPTQQTCVHPTAFRQQLKVMGARGAAPARPTAVAYTRFMTIVRLVATRLAEHGPAPRDLFDVYDFTVATLGPAPRARAASKKASVPSVAPAAEESDEADSSDD